MADSSDSADRDSVRAANDDRTDIADERPFTTGRMLGLIAGPVAGLFFFLTSPMAEMPLTAWQMIGVTAWMVIWWLSEAVPIPITSLLPIVLMPLLDLLPLDKVAANYADDLILLFLGGFIIAAGMERVNLHRRIALKIIQAVGTTPQMIVLGFMLATAFLSMWISNTATTVMMFAVGLSVVSFMDSQTDDETVARNFGVALMLSIAYSASIGGVGTIIGTPPNGLLVSFLGDEYGVEISFFQWMLLGVPVVAVMLPIAWVLLTKFLFPATMGNVEGSDKLIAKEVEALGTMSRDEKMVAVVFALAAFFWIFRKLIGDFTGIKYDDAIVAIAAAITIFAIPTGTGRNGFAVDWTISNKVPWGILLLFGGGLALASGFSSTGLAETIGNAVSGLEVTTWVLVLIVLVVIVFLTEITSNTASTATFLPILGAVAVGLGLTAPTLAIPVAIGASMAFMMPVATPPNAIVFAYEKMQLSDMVRAGIWLNIAGIVVAYGLFAVLGPLFFDVAIFGAEASGGAGGGGESAGGESTGG